MNLRNEVTYYAAKIGANRLLVQGAGGNISWKTEKILWIKASGTQLADALNTNIFVALDLAQVCSLIAAGSIDYAPACFQYTELRPSIETALHAFMPHRVVVHLHAVDVIALSVQLNAKDQFAALFAGLPWRWIDYVKPGLPLALAVQGSCQNSVLPDVLVLGNHGLVIGGDSVAEVDARLQDVLRRTYIAPRHVPDMDLTALRRVMASGIILGYYLPKNAVLHILALDPMCLEMTRQHWVLYPDHAVFLGGHATVITLAEVYAGCLQRMAVKPPLVLIESCGVLLSDNITATQLAMLCCYVDVILRLLTTSVASLKAEQIAELIDWEAEKYRQALSSNK